MKFYFCFGENRRYFSVQKKGRCVCYYATDILAETKAKIHQS